MSELLPLLGEFKVSSDRNCSFLNVNLVVRFAFDSLRFGFSNMHICVFYM